MAIELLEKYGFKSNLTKCQPLELVEIMKKDKKVVNDRITFIVPCDKKSVKEIKLLPEEVLSMFVQ